MPENLDTIHSKSTSHMAGLVPGTGEILVRKKIAVLARLELTVADVTMTGKLRAGGAPRKSADLVGW